MDRLRGTSRRYGRRTRLLNVRVVLEIVVLCLAAVAILARLSSAASARRLDGDRLSGRLRSFALVATTLAVELLGLRVGLDLVPAVGGWSYAAPGAVCWAALVATAAAVAAGLRDGSTRPEAGLYALPWLALSLGQLHRGYAPGRFFIWGAVCEWAGIVLVAGLIAWLYHRFATRARWLGRAGDSAFPRGDWFQALQAVLAAATAAVTVWIATDFSFDGMGQEVALFGLAGRQAACPAALMLLGAAILMAWQSSGGWRAGWQYAALAAGVLFTTSVGWARLPAPGPGGDPPWLAGSGNLMISAAMMTLLTRVGLARVLPRSGDWITRARRAAPVFGGLALLMLAVVVAGRYLR
jgi:hypothetical protein